MLQEHDNLRISTVPDWDSLATVRLQGEVTFPGSYRIRRGETLSQVLDRAGGLSEEAFAGGAIFLRDELRKREQEQINLLAKRLEADLTASRLESGAIGAAESIEMRRTLIAQLRSTNAVGRMVIDLEQIAVGGPYGELVGNIALREGDRLLVPKLSQEVTIIGETQQNTSHLYQPGLSQQDYIELSGGLTRRADKSLIYVVRASGAVIDGKRSGLFRRRKSVEIQPGDTIVVPLEVDRFRALTFWGSVTQILYQAAIAVAAVKTFDN